MKNKKEETTEEKIYKLFLCANDGANDGVNDGANDGEIGVAKGTYELVERLKKLKSEPLLFKFIKEILKKNKLDTIHKKCAIRVGEKYLPIMFNDFWEAEKFASTGILKCKIPAIQAMLNHIRFESYCIEEI